MKRLKARISVLKESGMNTGKKDWRGSDAIFRGVGDIFGDYDRDTPEEAEAGVVLFVRY